MFKNYFKTAYRYINRNKFFTLVNIIGLSSGLAVSILISLFVFNEFSYDQFNTKADRIFRVESDISVNGNGINETYVPAPVGIQMVKDFPQVENTVRLRMQKSMLVKKGNENIIEHSQVFADPSLFDVFTLPMIAGSPHDALREPNSIVLSESAAKKYFNTTDVIGKTLFIDNETLYKITGVIKDIPQESHFHFDFIKSMPAGIKNMDEVWLNPYAVTYVLTKPGVSNDDVNKMLSALATKYVAPQLQEMNKKNPGDASANFFRFYSIPLTKIHLFSNISMEFEPNGNIKTVWLFIIVAILILIMACVNFTNLATAFSLRRSVEIGVRKVLGSNRKNLITRFLLESILISFASTVVAILLSMLLLPYFNELAGKHFSAMIFFRPWMLAGSFALSLLVGLIAGSYPALYLSSFKPAAVLKDFSITGPRSSWLRNSLVVFQFVIANVLIIGTLVMYSQFKYISERNLGYNRNQVLTVANTYNLGSHAKSFKDEVDKLPGVMEGTMTAFLPNRDMGGDARAYFKDATANPNGTFLLNEWTVESNYIPFMGMTIVKGRNFSPDMPSDSSCVLLNQTAVRLLGYSADPVNKAIYLHDSNPEGGFKILGVVKDFNASSLHDKIEPIVFRLGTEVGAISFRINTTHISPLINMIKEKYQSMETKGKEPFTWSFMNDDFNNLYKADERTSKVYVAFTFFAIFIACLGLFGLVAYASQQRIKEISIRKVLGASTGKLIALLSKDFLKLIIIAIFIACPLAFWGSQKWLQDFAYRTKMDFWIFILAAFLTTAITLLTVFFQSIKVARVNPSKILRNE